MAVKFKDWFDQKNRNWFISKLLILIIISYFIM